MQGDDLISCVLVQTTRAIRIQALAGAIWPWLVQMGQGRGGFYSYDWLENLFGMDIHNSNQLLPKYQHLVVGDLIPFWKNAGVRVMKIESEHFMILAGSLAPDSEAIGGTWTFLLEEAGEGNTQLIVRARVAAFPPYWLSRLFSLLLLEPVHFIMERKMLLGIKSRAEGKW
jgi:hypothetical protein